MAELLKRTELTYDDLEVIDENRPESFNTRKRRGRNSN